MNIEIKRVTNVNVADFQSVLIASGLGARRPVDDVERLERMIKNSDLLISATHQGKIIGVARSITDFSYCCYLSDLAVDIHYQGQGIGKRLIEATREHAGPETMCLLLASPGAVSFYKALGMPQPDNAFLYQRQC
ncbi:GNAT family N-acetyltransferase [Saccharibacter sp. 17.LH.SD]|uniref:GNAT family N-acetyltransferase n=1 Tax=Saccharibacter sp. 17.LH.SD TaxID=2689393 RepID=UPI00136EC23C|nr:GNAT family N-acetyltransferase [Saccharibacter sp. 17.LH.SD]MXV44423.1 GNAT family N-acetyltransferase [Saccharibacter sp. 17.LH.SD]